MRPHLLITIALASILLACGASKPKHSLSCGDKIDDCMDECTLDPRTQDTCFAGCRTNISCD